MEEGFQRKNGRFGLCNKIMSPPRAARSVPGWPSYIAGGKQEVFFAIAQKHRKTRVRSCDR